MARLQWNHAAILSAISNSIDGRNIAEVCFSFRRLLELGIRQGHLIPVDDLVRKCSESPITIAIHMDLTGDFFASNRHVRDAPTM